MTQIKATYANVEQVVFNTLDDFNREMAGEVFLPKSPETCLFGLDGLLDSLGLVNLVIAVETRMEEDLGVTVTLVDEKAMSRTRNPFATVRSLIDFVYEVLESPEDGHA